MDLLRATDRTTSAWKNGGGTTTEIAADPAGASLDDFAWRVSTAEVRTSGPFSRFDGIDRTLLLIRGQALSLRVAGMEPALLSPESPPFEFPGDAATEGEPIGGPITDLNVMTRRGQWRSRVRRLRTSHGPVVVRAADATLMLALDGDLHILGTSGPAKLVRGDAVLLSAGEGLDLSPLQAGQRAVLIDFWRAG